MDPEILKIIVPEDYFSTFYKEGIRPDQRPIDKARRVAVSYNGQSAIVRLGDTMVMTQASDSTSVVLNDDGNLIEAKMLGEQVFAQDIAFAMTFAEVCGYFVRDPTKEEENMASSVLTICIQSSGVKVHKTKGLPISLMDLETLVELTKTQTGAAFQNLQKIKSQGYFEGDFY